MFHLSLPLSLCTSCILMFHLSLSLSLSLCALAVYLCFTSLSLSHHSHFGLWSSFSACLHPSVHPSIHICSACLFVSFSFCPNHLSLSLSTCLPVSSVCASIHPCSAYQFVSFSLCLSIYLSGSVCLFAYEYVGVRCGVCDACALSVQAMCICYYCCP